MIIKKTKGLKIFNFLIKEYHINEQMKRLKREKDNRKSHLNEAEVLFRLQKAKKLKIKYCK